MENNQQPLSTEDQDLIKLTKIGNANLYDAAKWAKILAIISLSLMALLIVIIFVVSMVMPSGLGIMMVFLYAIILGIASLPIIFLYKFAVKAREALEVKNENTLADAFGALKTSYLIQFVMTMIVLVFYAVAMIVALAMGGSMLSSLGRF